jgi:hypothetical protein
MFTVSTENVTRNIEKIRDREAREAFQNRKPRSLPIARSATHEFAYIVGREAEGLSLVINMMVEQIGEQLVDLNEGEEFTFKTNVFGSTDYGLIVKGGQKGYTEDGVPIIYGHSARFTSLLN